MFRIATTELFSTNDKCIKKPIDLRVAAIIVLPVQDFQPKLLFVKCSSVRLLTLRITQKTKAYLHVNTTAAFSLRQFYLG